MDNHLVVLVQDNSVHIDILMGNYDYEDYNQEDDEPATLLAFNLQDHTVQEVEMDADLRLLPKLLYLSEIWRKSDYQVR